MSTAIEIDSRREVLSDQWTRGGCIDRLSWHGSSECGPLPKHSHACASHLRGTYSATSKDRRSKMRKSVLMMLGLMAAMMGTALAAKQTAFCPYDGELAQWTGIQKGAFPNQVCEYKHFFFDTKTKQSVKHIFWHACDS